MRAFDIKGAAFDLTCSGLDPFSHGNRSLTKSSGLDFLLLQWAGTKDCLLLVTSCFVPSRVLFSLG